MAYEDGEMDAATRAAEWRRRWRLDARQWRKRVEPAPELRGRLRAAPRPVLDETRTERLLASVRGAPPAAARHT